jgi:hypothetical protein
MVSGITFLKRAVLELLYACGRIAQVRIEQRKRESEGRSRVGIEGEAGGLVRILVEAPNSQNCATHARTRGKTPPLGSAWKCGETVPPGTDGGGNVPVIETSLHRTA